jgi:hypothetical protein
MLPSLFSTMKFSPHGITVIIAMEPLLSLSKPASLNLMMQVIMHIAAVVGDLARLRQNIYNYYFAKRERVSGFFFCSMEGDANK